MAARTLQKGESKGFETRLLLECPVLYESPRPFLETLKSLHPLQVPFAQYLTQKDLNGKAIALPLYAQVPGFTWDVSVLLHDGASIDRCSFDPRSSLSVQNARETLYKHGKLDPRYVFLPWTTSLMNVVRPMLSLTVSRANFVSFKAPPGLARCSILYA